jgi:hypothetical protein
VTRSASATLSRGWVLRHLGVISDDHLLVEACNCREPGSYRPRRQADLAVFDPHDIYILARRSLLLYQRHDIIDSDSAGSLANIEKKTFRSNASASSLLGLAPRSCGSPYVPRRSFDGDCDALVQHAVQDGRHVVAGQTLPAMSVGGAHSSESVLPLASCGHATRARFVPQRLGYDCLRLARGGSIRAAQKEADIKEQAAKLLEADLSNQEHRVVHAITLSSPDA